jgi:two-component system, chemotaxis family, protein-glutamate methylesterase/glutaminase
MVVVGTSLGGLHALQVLLACLPPHFRAPVAIVQHRARASEGGLRDLLQAVCRLPVVEPEDKEPIEPGHVYLAPADYHLLVEGDHLALSTEGPVNYSRPSIDVLFESAAHTCGPHLVAVVLTGANEDGARGAQRVAAGGGTVLIQDPALAESAIMPAAAAARIAATRTYSLEEVGARLIALCAGERLTVPAPSQVH